MNAGTPTSLFHRLWLAVSAAPAPLVAYAAFVVIVVLTDFVFLRFAPEPFRAGLVQYTGWVDSSCYAFTVFFAFALMFPLPHPGLSRFLGLTLQLLLQIAYGVYLFFQPIRPNYGNPYFTVSEWQPLWTIVLPAVWIALLHTPGMNRFCRARP